MQILPGHKKERRRGREKGRRRQRQQMLKPAKDKAHLHFSRKKDMKEEKEN